MKPSANFIVLVSLIACTIAGCGGEPQNLQLTITYEKSGGYEGMWCEWTITNKPLPSPSRQWPPALPESESLTTVKRIDTKTAQELLRLVRSSGFFNWKSNDTTWWDIYEYTLAVEVDGYVRKVTYKDAHEKGALRAKFINLSSRIAELTGTELQIPAPLTTHKDEAFTFRDVFLRWPSSEYRLVRIFLFVMLIIMTAFFGILFLRRKKVR